MALIPIISLAVLEEDDRLRIRRRIIRPPRIDAYNFPENEFVKLFRVNKFIFAEIVEKLRPALEPRASRRNVFSVETKVLCALRFFATGSYQKCVANDIVSSMAQQSVSNNIRRVTDAINSLMFENHIKFPAHEREIQIGAIDCTHVAIIAPPDDEHHNEKNYVNRKGFHSLNVQLVCDMHLKILSVCARFPGCTHDSYIWKVSRLRDWFVANSSSLKDTWLLGDSGYPPEPFLMTPVDGQDTQYNIARQRGRCVIERCNGVLKSRFRCLSKARALNYSGMIVNACVVLHNMCIDQNITIQEDIAEEDEPFDTGEPDSNPSRYANTLRNKIMQFFQ